MNTIVICTGGYDPLHAGHIAYFECASKLGDKLFVGVNSDAWLTRKKGRFFMPYIDRVAIVQNLRMVDEIIDFNDDDNSSTDAIRQVRSLYPDSKIIFANGGDRTQDNIPEMSLEDDNVHFAFGIGGENKMNSSSWILDEWKAPKTTRPWGYYRVLHTVDGTKVKELTVNPGCSLSMQKHDLRTEYWIVTEGKCQVYYYHHVNHEYLTVDLEKHAEAKIKKGTWHRLSNPYDVPCRIVEIQHGASCIEEDIQRLLD